jgi:hypothetical protein
LGFGLFSHGVRGDGGQISGLPQETLSHRCLFLLSGPPTKG